MKWQTLLQGGVIVAGLAVGAYFSNISYQQHEQLGHGDLQAHKAMNHGNLDISNDSILPNISDFQVLKDPMSGWNIYLEVQNFRFAPERASQAHRPGEGHAHLYINGNKIARLYGNWFHIPELVYPKNKIKVTLNANDHQTLMVGGEVIGKTLEISK